MTMTQTDSTPRPYHRLIGMPVSTDPTINPASPESHWLYEQEQTGYVIDLTAYALPNRRTGKRPVTLRYLTSHGTFGGIEVGDRLTVVVDNARDYSRTYPDAQIVGIHNHATGDKVGNVPAKAIKMMVAK